MLLPLIEKAREQSAHFGMLTGLVGATGGLGGFFLPFLLGAIKQQTGQYSGWLFFLLVLPCGAALVLLQLGTHWHLRWRIELPSHRAGILSYQKLLRALAPEVAE